MGKQLAALAALVGACMLAAGCTNVVDGTAVAADKSGPLHQDPIPVSALEGLLLDLSQINAALGATSMKVWFNAKAMWDWSKSVADKNCLAIDGPAQEKVYAGTGWTAMRGQRLDDSIDDSKKRATTPFKRSSASRPHMMPRSSTAPRCKAGAAARTAGLSKSPPDRTTPPGLWLTLSTTTACSVARRFRKAATDGPASVP